MEEIRRYVMGEMPLAERNSFDRLIEKDPILKREVNGMRLTIANLRQHKKKRQEIRALLEEAESELPPLRAEDFDVEED